MHEILGTPQDLEVGHEVPQNSSLTTIIFNSLYFLIDNVRYNRDKNINKLGLSCTKLRSSYAKFS
jgi:hypothetical protein